MTVRAAADVGAGLAPARDARPIVPGERIHVVGAAGAGASAAALLAAWAGAAVDGCDPGGPGPYTPALDAAGIEMAPAHDPSHVRRGLGGGPPARLAVTKALTAIDPGNAELAAARELGDPDRAVAAGRRRRRRGSAAGRRRGDARQEHLRRAGSSTSWRRPAAIPGAFVGALLPAALTGLGVAATARRGAGEAFVVEADEYAGNFDAYRPDVIVLTSAEWDHPDVFADRAAVLAAFEAWIRRAGAGGTDDAGLRCSSRTSATRASPSSSRGSPTGPGGSSRRRSSTRPRSGSAASRAGSRSGSRAPPARPTSLLGRITATEPDATTLEIAGLDPLTGPRPVRLPTAGRHNAMNALGVAGAAAALGVDAAAIAAGLAGFGGVGRRLERKGEAGGRRGVRRLRAPSDGHPRDARRGAPARARPPRLGGLRAPDLSTARRRCSTRSPTPSPGPTPSPSPTSGPAATRTPR